MHITVQRNSFCLLSCSILERTVYSTMKTGIMANQTMERKTAVKTSIGRAVFAAVSIIIEFILIVALATSLSIYAEWIALATRLFSFILVLLIYSRYQTSSMKTPWIILILVLPIVGVVMYLMVGFAGTPQQMQTRFEHLDRQLTPRIRQKEDVLQAAKAYDPHIGSISSYLYTRAAYPVFKDSEVHYYSDSSSALQAMLDDLQYARKFIFMEYHAIEDAESWVVIQDILAAKARAGVEVRLFYDDVGSMSFLNSEFVKRMESFGIQCRVFNPIVPVLKLFLNNRDHRKITVIDGDIGYTGGFNLANEYFNLTHPYGHWKDAGIRITGSAVRSMTVMFLEMWNAIRDSDLDDTDFDRYLPMADFSGISGSSPKSGEKETGFPFIQPYGDIPTDKEQVGENVYIGMIEQAVDYIYLSSPYLIITDEMIHALGLAAKRGVDVRIITPGIPDKKLVYEVTRSYYHGLVRHGVRIYEYTPGFCHSKLCVTDDKAAICGTINLDYRSLYHHFEDAVLFYRCSAVMDVKKDFEDTFPLCREVTEQYNTGRSHLLRFSQIALRLFAPLL